MRETTLKVGDSTIIAAPSVAQIREALVALEGARDPFVILSSPDDAFIQAYGSPKTGYVLEHRPAGGQIVAAADPAVPLATVVRVFEAFSNSPGDPLAGLERAAATLPDARPLPWGSAPWVMGLGLLIVAAVWLTSGSEPAIVRASCAFAAAVFGAFAVDALRFGQMYFLGLRLARATNPLGFRLAVLMHGFIAALGIAGAAAA